MNIFNDKLIVNLKVTWFVGSFIAASCEDFHPMAPSHMAMAMAMVLPAAPSAPRSCDVSVHRGDQLLVGSRLGADLPRALQDEAARGRDAGATGGHGASEGATGYGV